MCRISGKNEEELMRKLLLATVATVGASMGLMAAAHAQSAPGSAKFSLDGRINWYAGIEGSSFDNTGGTKISTDSFFGYLRLFPTFSGVAANGLHYGVGAEIRENGQSSPTAGSSTQTLFVHQEYGYLGLPKYGQVSVGEENGPIVLFETGTFEGFNDGGWWGDLPAITPINPAYPFVDTDFNQVSDKIVYLSPTIAGFQFAVGFTPNQTESYTPAITSTSADTFQGNVGGNPKNLIDIGGQYTNTFGPVGIQVGADYQHAGQVGYTGTPTGLTYKDLNIVTGGATATIAGFQFGGNAIYGAFNGNGIGSFSLEPSGGTSSIGTLFGAQYTFGPVVVGGSVFRFQTTGNVVGNGSGGYALTSGQQANDGLALGGTYTLVPGVSLFVDYDAGFRTQGGYDWYTGSAGDTGNRIQSQLFGVGTQISW